MKILLVVGETNRGGTETWLLNIARELQDQCQFHFLVHTSDEGAYDRELLKYGARILPCANPQNPFLYARNFLRILARSGPYDVVHSHVQSYSGWVLFLAWLAGVPTRIAHSHSNLRQSYENGGFLRKCYMRAMRASIRMFANQGLATSASAAESMFGHGSDASRRWRIHKSCVDLDRFAQVHRREEIRNSLAIPESAIVVGHVGSFRPEKNHAFALQVAAELCSLSTRYRFVFKGEGALKNEAQKQASDLGIRDRCTFLPADDDVARVLRGAVDLFVFPSLREGLGLALVEAQAAGLRCFASDGLPLEAIAVPELVTVLRLRDGPAKWAQAIHAKAGQPAPLPQPIALNRVRESGFDMRANAASLMKVYSQAA